MAQLVVTKKYPAASGVAELRLRHPAGEPLPEWSPGAHVDVTCGPGLVRQYSLCGDPGDLTEYRIGVLREPDGRGGSQALHDDVEEGAMLEVSVPRNHFALEKADGYLFAAGGIGITPILPMIGEAQRSGRPWRLLYGGRTRSSMAFVEELAGFSGRVSIVPQDEYGLLDIAAALTGLSAGTLIYCCGPGPMLAAMERECAKAGLGAVLRVERFSPAPREGAESVEFEVELASCGRRLRVPADRTLLDVLCDAGLDVRFSCEEGICGSCETEVLAGIPDHRDSILTDQEREAGNRMMVCVSRSRTPVLTLNL